MSQPDSFSIDQMKFICWVQVIYLLGWGISIFLVPKGVPPPYLSSFFKCVTYIHFFTCLYIIYVPYLYIFHVIFTCPRTTSLSKALFVFQMRKLPTNGCFFFFFFPWVNHAVFQLIRWNLPVGLGDLEQCHCNVIITFLMLKKRCNSLNCSQLWKTDCHFFSIFFRRV